ncbi:hypothetical protein SAMN05660463_00745 [Pseudomonas sp. URIL14HWK12:I9]|nr:hypothetical protein F474_00659 [Pseudomonas sp. URIL14HWK12:I12]PVZ27132.1 hypothetical protein F470_00314 [Pseudomonas sp. URIL14HWK12:I10]PVZ38021.1 hypothetical protein F472_00659 [Pseudomonas sp. URIL14HWK12:I11]SNZ04794.1 hypothetical protein SAMN05660463_00745 [Pseudomonas sp. URIL14HWK12:I9]
MSMDDREWMRREREERFQAGRARARARAARSSHLAYPCLILLLVAVAGCCIWRGWYYKPPAAASVTAHDPAPPEPLPRSLAPAPVAGTIPAPRVSPPPHVQTPKPAPQGLVSQAYLERFRAERARPRAQANTFEEQDSQWIDSWDHRQRYLAHWSISDNSIDGTSVCDNHRRGSIEYRECRKGAKVFFREQCRSWASRASDDGQPWSERMKARYCSADSAFSPL